VSIGCVTLILPFAAPSLTNSSFYSSLTKHKPTHSDIAPSSLECPIGSNGGLCSNLGICGFDSGLGSSRCFCDDGYISADCSKPSNPVPAGAITAAFFGGSLLAAAGLLGFGYFRLRYLKYTQEAASAGEGFYGLAAE